MEPFPKMQIFNSSKLKEFADDKFKFNENVKNFSKEIEIMSSFFFSHSVFKRLVLQTLKNQGLFGKGLKYFEMTKYCSNDLIY